MSRTVIVTGVGLVSCVGEGPEAQLAALDAGTPPRTDAESFAPYAVHPAPAITWDRQIPKKSDQRQMEAWQRLGVYAAGLALEAAGVKEDAAFKQALHLVVAAGGGERDYAADGAILTGLRDAPEPGAFLNERLQNDLRPTLFLAQLSNLLAGNIAIVHGVTGASRTFMGEEAAGVDALRVAQARIASGQTAAMLVGGSYSAERPDALLVHAMGGFAKQGAFAPVFARPAPGGFILASCAAFLMLESAEHAAARGATALARLGPVASGRSRREPGSVGTALSARWAEAGAEAPEVVVSGATGVGPITAEEHDTLGRLAPSARIHGLGDLIGHGLEVAAPFGAALAAVLLAQGRANEIAVTTVGHRRGEGVMRLMRA